MKIYILIILFITGFLFADNVQHSMLVKLIPETNQIEVKDTITFLTYPKFPISFILNKNLVNSPRSTVHR